MGTRAVHPEPAQLPVLSRGGSSPRSETIFGKSFKISGKIYSEEDLYINGDIEGTLEVHDHKLTIGANATVRADVTAGQVVVLGTIHGNVEASERIDIRKDAKVIGDMRTPSILIEDGAHFTGGVDILHPHSSHHPAQGSP